MQDVDKTKEDLVTEVAHLHQRIAEMEASERERKQVEEALERSEQEKTAIFDSISEHIVHQDTRMRVLWANRAAGESVGVDPQRLVGSHCYDIWQQRRKPCVGCPVIKARKSGQPQEAEMTTPDGRVWFIRGYPVHDKKGNITGTVEVTLEITARKRAEEALKENEERYRTLVENINCGINLIDADHNIIMVNTPTGYKFNKPVLEIAGKKCFREFEKRDVACPHCPGVQTLATGKPAEAESEGVRDDGSRFDVRVQTFPIMEQDGKVTAFIEFVEDITERKQIEEELRKSEEKYRELINGMNDTAWVIDFNGNFIDVNDAAVEVLGYSREELLAMGPYDIDSSLDAEKITGLIKGMQTDKLQVFETSHTTKDGKLIPVEIKSSLVTYKEKQAILSIARDITKRKQAEEELQQSEERYRFLFENSQTINLLIGTDGKILDVNESAMQSLGYKKKSIIGKDVLEFVIPEQRETVAEQLTQELRGNYTPPLEIDITTEKGTRTLLFTEGHATLFEKGELIGMLFSAVDITERKKSENELRIKDNAIASSNNAIAIGEFRGNLTYVNPMFLKMWGYDNEREVLGKPPVNFWHMKEKAQEIIEALLKGEPVIGELKAKRKDGSLFDAQLSASIITDNTGKPISMMASFVDITERKQAEDSLRESEERFRTICETAQDFIALKDRDCKFTYVNPAVERHFGIPASKLIGKTSAAIFGKEKSVHIIEEDLRVLSGEIINEEHPSPVEGSSIIHHIIKVPIRNSAGEIIGLCNIGRDITERKQIEEALRKSEERFRRVVETMEVGLGAINENGVYTYVNEYLSKMLRYSMDEMIGRSALDFVYDEEDRKAQEEIFAKRRAGMRDTTPYEVTRRRKDGQKVYSILSPTPSFDADGRFIGSFGIYTDITERNRMEQELRESEERFRTIVETAPSLLMISDQEGNNIYVSPNCEEITGYKQEELLGSMKWWVHEDDTARAKEVFDRTFREAVEVKNFEYKAVRKNGELWYASSSWVALKDNEGKCKGVVMQTVDITERKEAEEALKKSEESYRLLSENIPVAVYSALPDEHSTTLFLSGQFLELTGYPMEQFLNDPELWTSILHPEDRDYVWDKVEEHRRTKDLLEVEYRIITKNNVVKWVRDRAKPVLDENGQIIRIDGFMEDITKRKQTEEELRQSEEKYRSLVESSEDSIYLVDNKNNYIFLNNKLLSRLGVQSSQVIGKGYSEFHSPKEAKDFAQRVQTVLKTGKSQSYEYRSQRDNRYFIRTLSPVTSPDGGVIKAITVISKDITERKQAEEKLREREAFNYALFQYNPVETIVVDLEGRVTGFNLAKKNAGDRLPKIGDLMYKDYAGKHEIDMRAELMRCIRSSEIKKFPERKYGDKYLTITISPFSQGAIIISEDITDRKQMEGELRDSEEKLKNIVENSTNIFYSHTPEHILTYQSPQVKDILGYTPDEAMVRWTEFVSDNPINKEGFKLTAKAIETGKPQPPYEQELIHKNGKKVWVEVREVPVVVNGKTISIVGALTDITERKRAEELLQKERDTFYSILDRAPYGVMVVDADGNHSFVNSEFTNITGYTLEDVPTGKDWHRQAYPDPHYRNMVNQAWRQHLALREADVKFHRKFKRSFSRSFAVVCKDGATKDIEFRRTPIGDGGAIIMLSDITERQRMHALLETAAAEWRTTFDAISDAVCLLDSHGKIIRCNNAMLSLLGKPFSQISNHHCWEVMHGVSKAPNSCPIALAGKTNHRETEVMFKDSCWFNISVDPLLDEEGNFVGGVHIMSDITDRMRIQNELQDSREQLRNLTVYLQSVREQERTNIAREIHDELAQALTALKMDVSWLDRRLPADAQSLSEKTESMGKLIDSTIQTVKRISAELRPGVLDDLGLVAAIEWQAEEFQNRTGIMCHITVDPQDLMVDQDRSTAIFRIFQETLTNVARHARATRVAVSLKERAGKLTLRVRDNGIGITEEQVFAHQSFGLIGIRERVHPWGGKVSIKGIPGKGTTVQVSVELARSKNGKEKIE